MPTRKLQPAVGEIFHLSEKKKFIAHIEDIFVTRYAKKLVYFGGDCVSLMFYQN